MQKTIDKENFKISQDIVKKLPQGVILKFKIIAFILMILILWFNNFQILNSLVNTSFYTITFLISVYLIIRLSPQVVTDIIVSIFVPKIMKHIDSELKLIKLALLKNIQCKVLDFGCATGLYLPYYKNSSKKVTEIIALEPNLKMHQDLANNIKKQGLQEITTITNKFIEDLKFQDGYFDSIILGNVMCEITYLQKTMETVEKLLKPGGRVYYIEHVIEDKGNFRRIFQKSVNWYWKVIAGGCNCNKESLKYIKSIKSWQNYNWTIYLDNFLYPIQRMEIGLCIKQKQ